MTGYRGLTPEQRFQAAAIILRDAAEELLARRAAADAERAEAERADASSPQGVRRIPTADHE